MNGDGSGALPGPIDAERHGFALAEGAALLVLEDASRARARGARILAFVLGGASGGDGERGERESASADAVARTIAQACADADVESRALDAVSLGFKTTVVADACRGVEVSEGDTARALEELAAAGVNIKESGQLIGAQMAGNS